jgi:hypothetical protein
MGAVLRPLPLLALAVLAAAGCGSSGESATPTACLGPRADYLKALRSAPGEVRLAGETPISDCLSGTQGAGDQAQVGGTVVGVATELNAAARRNPGSRPAVLLGYLAGAVHEGASHSSGIATDLVRRLDAAARFNPGSGTLGAAFERGFGKGYAAGQEGG